MQRNACRAPSLLLTDQFQEDEQVAGKDLRLVLALTSVLSLTAACGGRSAEAQVRESGSSSASEVPFTAATAPPVKATSESTTRTTSAAESTASTSNCSTGEGFSGSLMSSYPPRPAPYGASSPIEAVKTTRWGRPAGYGTDHTVWTTATSKSDSVTLIGTGVTLDVVQLPDHSWVVLNGQRC
jgi:hypothetical protein